MKENADNVSAEKKHMIDVVHLSKHFGDLVVLDDISDTVYEGEKVCIIGPSGSGKSTYLRCLNVLEDPTSGKVIFDGEDLCDLKVDINLHRQKMGMVFQQFNLFNNMTVKKNITMAPVHIGKKKIRTVKRKKFLYENRQCIPQGEKAAPRFAVYGERDESKRRGDRHAPVGAHRSFG